VSDGVGTCRVREATLERGYRAIVLENDLLAASVLPDKGADIYELIYKPKELDVLWKSPWGLRPLGAGFATAANSWVAWTEHYEGGWQEIFPNGGAACDYNGVELNFHGEASSMGWDAEIVQPNGDSTGARFSVRLARSPLKLERLMRIEAGKPILIFQERIINEGGEPIDYMWGHHPAYGAPFIDGSCRIDTNARTFRADDRSDAPGNPLTPGGRFIWPIGQKAGVEIDLSRIPGSDVERGAMAYLGNFDGETAWYGITNTALGMGVGLVWRTATFPHAWLWQEMHSSPGFPWYKNVYVMAIEPFTTVPNQGLTTAIETTGTHRTLAPGESAEAELRAVFYESGSGIARIDLDGTVVGKG
jgi:galactose mutarotase-like enzyme